MNSLRFGPAVFLLALLAGGVAVALHGNAADQPLLRVKRARYIMGTIFEITAYGTDRLSTEEAVEEAFATIRKADRVMSHYRDDSELAELNRLGAGRSLVVSEDLAGVLRESLRYWKLSGGAFDITVGPLVRLWQEAADAGRIPEPATIREALQRIGTDAMQPYTTTIDGRTVRGVKFLRDGVEVNLGAIGKGWAVDEAVAVLRRHGIRDALVNAGTSTLYALGNDGEESGWEIELVDPCDRSRSIAGVRLNDASVSSSAAYERYWEIEGVRFSHILDPRTGYPVEPIRAVTVVGQTATETDAISTAVYVLGAEEGGALLDHAGMKGILVTSDGQGNCSAEERGTTVGADGSGTILKGEGHG